MTTTTCISFKLRIIKNKENTHFNTYTFDWFTLTTDYHITRFLVRYKT